MSRKIHEEKKAYWQLLINQQQVSGKTITSFCKEKKLHVKNFYRWKGLIKRSQNKSLSENTFVEITPDRESFEFQIQSKGRIFKFKNPDFIFIEKFMRLLKSL